MTGTCAYLNTREAAEYLGLSTRTLDRYRVSGDGPVFLKFGGRVRYLLEDLDACGTSASRSPFCWRCRWRRAWRSP